MCGVFSPVSRFGLTGFWNHIKSSLKEDIKKSICQTEGANYLWVAGPPPVWKKKKTQLYSEVHKLMIHYFCCAECSFFFFFLTQGRARWMRQLFISQLQHLFCTYSPLVAYSSVAASILRLLLLQDDGWQTRCVRYPLETAAPWKVHLLSEMTNGIMQMLSS